MCKIQHERLGERIPNPLLLVTKPTMICISMDTIQSRYHDYQNHNEEQGDR